MQIKCSQVSRYITDYVKANTRTAQMPDGTTRLYPPSDADEGVNLDLDAMAEYIADRFQQSADRRAEKKAMQHG